MKARRIFSVREHRHGPHRRNKSAEPSHRNQSVEAFFGIFKPDNARTNPDQEKEKAKADEVVQLLSDVNITHVSTEHVREMLNSEYSAGDPAKAAEFIEMQHRASVGTIVPYNPKIQMAGAENRGKVTCYLDSLLFAMFAHMTAYESMLQNDFSDEPRKKLVTLLRLWVNMLRSGKLVHTDMAKAIQEALAECGWQDAKELEQQDTSEAFAFITEALQLPLLRLQVDLFHQGKRDDDDHKIVHERLLNLAVPKDPEGKGLRLEDCLEEYFNTQVNVLRDSHEEKESRRPATSRLDTIRLVTRDDDSEAPEKVMESPIQMSPGLERRPAGLAHASSSSAAGGESANASADRNATAQSSQLPPRYRSTSVIQNVVVDDKGKANDSDLNSNLVEKARRKSSTVVKAVTIPAWQFFRLFPWHAAGSNNEPQNDREVAMNFSQKPVVGICLKRYGLNDRNYPMRINTFIDIPDSLKLPQFMVTGEAQCLEDDPYGLSADYKLVLQSVICHRGDSVNEGHYVTFARVAPKLLTGNRRHDFDPPPDYEEAQWVKFDDLQWDSRVSYVDDFRKALKEEMPYLLFYQIVPMVEVALTDETETTEPPSYADSSRASIPTSTAPSLSDSGQLGVAQQHAPVVGEGDYFDSKSRPPWAGPSLRVSSEAERPCRASFENDTDHDEDGDGAEGRGRDTLARTSDAAPPGTIVPGVTPGGTEESSRELFSRAAALFTNKSKSRPPSQSGEGRKGLTIKNLSGFIRASKDSRDPNSIAASVSTPPVTGTGTGTEPPSGETSCRPSADFVRASLESESRVDVGSEGKGEATTPRGGHEHVYDHKGEGSGTNKKNKLRAKGGVPPDRECIVM